MTGQRGRQRCHQFSVEAMVEKIDQLYMELSQIESIIPDSSNQSTNQLIN